MVDRNVNQGIVVGVHGSAASVAALRWAAREALLRGSCLHVVRVLDEQAHQLAPYARPHSPAGHEDRGAACDRLEEAAQAALGCPPPAAVTVEVADGLPAQVLIERAARAELLVVGSAAGAGDVLGPVARACALHAPCPVVIISPTNSPVPVPA